MTSLPRSQAYFPGLQGGTTKIRISLYKKTHVNFFANIDFVHFSLVQILKNVGSAILKYPFFTNVRKIEYDFDLFFRIRSFQSSTAGGFRQGENVGEFPKSALKKTSQ